MFPSRLCLIGRVRLQAEGKEETAVGEMSVLPILGAVGSESPSPAQPTKLSMQLPAFSELHRISPLRATLAAMLAVLQQRSGLSGGCAPLLPASTSGAASGAAAEGTCSGQDDDSRGSSPRTVSSSRNSSPAESPGSSSSNGTSQSSHAISHTSSDSAALNGNSADLHRRKSRVRVVSCKLPSKQLCVYSPYTSLQKPTCILFLLWQAHTRHFHLLQVKEEEQLLLFALKRAENFEPLGRWIELQLESNPALAAVRDIAAERCTSSFLSQRCTFLTYANRLASLESSKDILGLARIGVYL